MIRARAAALTFASAVLALVAAPSAALGQSAPVYAESSADALVRNVRILADRPKDFNALVGAGKAALALGDPQSAAGFFGLAEEVYPNSPMPKAGMGAAAVMTGDPYSALTYFARAQQLGGSLLSFAADRGLAYDLLGRHSEAIADYRTALAGADRDEARRRLALSLAITGRKDEALATLAPLVARGDSGAARCRALVLALSGDTQGANRTLEARMPGSAAAMGPFFRRLPTLASVQKAAAVHLGIFPGSGVAMASSSTVVQPPQNEDRLTSIEQLLTETQADASQTSLSRYAQPTRTATASVRRSPVRLASIPRARVEQVASPNNDLIETARVASDGGGKKIWLQLASGTSAGELPDQFQRIRARKPSLFTGISGFVADERARARLLIGPFHSDEDARLFADALDTVRINSFRWVSQPGQVVRKLSTQ